jgi:NAD(P)-dependent dehydrogenase (short-subunit alcohol dehydrogenase family)
MKLRHPLSGAIYTVLEDQTVRVEAHDGDEGLFRSDGTWIRGKLRSADPQFLGFIAGPSLPSRSASTASPATAEAKEPRAPTLNTTRQNSDERRKEMDLGLDGCRALVTAGSRGIGLAIAQTLADQGCDIAICARGAEGLELARKDLETRGAKVFTKAVDVSDGDGLEAFVNEAGEALGGLDVYVSNASAGGGPGLAGWQPAFDIDVMGAVRGIGAATPLLTKSEAGSVVIIGSTAAIEYLGIPQAYSAMKAALVTYANDMSQSLAPQGIRVNVVSPGPIYFEGGNWEMIKQAMPQMYESALAQCAIGRMGTPEEVARAVVFLASPAASLITGANLVADGGFTKRAAF